MLVWSHSAWVCGLKLPCYIDHAAHLESHPAWVCGLKPNVPLVALARTLSHPAWVCGLKLNGKSTKLMPISHTLRGCVD